MNSQVKSAQKQTSKQINKNPLAELVNVSFIFHGHGDWKTKVGTELQLKPNRTSPCADKELLCKQKIPGKGKPEIILLHDSESCKENGFFGGKGEL